MGKTTLVRAVCGLRPPTITQGSVRYDGTDITRRSPHQISRTGVAIVPQGRRVFGSLTTLENLTVVPPPPTPPAAAPRTGERVLEFFPRLAARPTPDARSLPGRVHQTLPLAR